MVQICGRHKATNWLTRIYQGVSSLLSSPLPMYPRRLRPKNQYLATTIQTLNPLLSPDNSSQLLNSSLRLPLELNLSGDRERTEIRYQNAFKPLEITLKSHPVNLQPWDIPDFGDFHEADPLPPFLGEGPLRPHQY